MVKLPWPCVIYRTCPTPQRLALCFNRLNDLCAFVLGSFEPAAKVYEDHVCQCHHVHVNVLVGIIMWDEINIFSMVTVAFCVHHEVIRDTLMVVLKNNWERAFIKLSLASWSFPFLSAILSLNIILSTWELPFYVQLPFFEHKHFLLLQVFFPYVT